MRQCLAIKPLFSFVTVMGFAAGAVIGAGQSASASDFAFNGRIGLEQDLRDRGLSLSDFDISPYFSIELAQEKGFFIGAYGAFGLKAAPGFTASPAVAAFTPREAEIEFYAGYTTTIGAYDFAVSAELDSFYQREDIIRLGGEERAGGDQYFPELKATISRDLGLIYGAFSVAYAPDGRWFTPDDNSLYLQSRFEIPIPYISDATVIARFGRDIRENRGDVSDYTLGFSYFTGPLEWTVFWQKSTQNAVILRDLDKPYDPGKGRVTAGVAFHF